MRKITALWADSREENFSWAMSLTLRCGAQIWPRNSSISDWLKKMEKELPQKHLFAQAEKGTELEENGKISI
jgi:hypothetical protein